MSFTIAIAGKGGTGKTTLAALIIRILKEKKSGSVLAIDADPNSNLADLLGRASGQTIGEIIDRISSRPEDVPAGMTKDRFIEYQVQTAIEEAEGFDILSMGRPEAPGCYCYVNNVLRNVMSKIINDYKYVVIDNEAGLEHLSRRTTRSADCLLVVSEAKPIALKAAVRIIQIVRELKIKTKKNLLVLNRYSCGFDPKALSSSGLEFSGNIPEDPELLENSYSGRSIFELSGRSGAFMAAQKLLETIIK